MGWSCQVLCLLSPGGTIIFPLCLYWLVECLEVLGYGLFSHHCIPPSKGICSPKWHTLLLLLQQPLCDNTCMWNGLRNRTGAEGSEQTCSLKETNVTLWRQERERQTLQGEWPWVWPQYSFSVILSLVKCRVTYYRFLQFKQVERSHLRTQQIRKETFWQHSSRLSG